MDEMKKNGPGPGEDNGPPPIEFMYRGIPKLDCAPVPESGMMEADVVVVGCGGSGIPAAVSAFENGAKRVVIIEKQQRAGGNSVMARSLFACKSSVLRQAMVKSDKDEIFTNAMNWHHYTRVNGRVRRAWINQSGNTIDWLRKRAVEFEVNTTTRMTYDIAPHWHCVKDSTMATPMAHLVEELCDVMGIDRRLVQTVEEYNANKGDPIFHKDARYLTPIEGGKYYVAKFRRHCYGVMGGLRINYRAELQDVNCDSIPGLYAAGNDANSIYTDTYPFVLSGNTSSFAINTGRIAGEQAAAYAKTQH